MTDMILKNVRFPKPGESVIATIHSDGSVKIEEVAANGIRERQTTATEVPSCRPQDDDWHTETPGKNGWYVCKSSRYTGYDVGYWSNGRFLNLRFLNTEDVTKWKKIEEED